MNQRFPSLGVCGLGAVFLSLTIFVTEISGSVVIVRPQNKTITVPEGSNVVIECVYPATETVEWLVSGLPIKNDTHDLRRFVIDKESRGADGKVTSRLTIKNINRTEGGSYTCRNADLEKGLIDETETDEAKVKVLKANTVLKIKGPAVISQGQDLLITCTGDITSDLIWHFQGNLLTMGTDGHITITTEINFEKGRQTSALTRQQVILDHGGKYSCYDRVNKNDASIQIAVVVTTDDGIWIRSPSTLLAIASFSAALMSTTFV